MTENNAMVAVESRELATFGTNQAFEMLQRQAKLLASSCLLPTQFSIFEKDGVTKKRPEEHQYAIANAAIAIELAARIGASPIMVAQNLYIVHGRPGWSSQFTIAAINACGRFSPLRFFLAGEGDGKTCYAWVIEKATGDRLEGPPVSIKMAKDEGWYGKNGSKWKTMPDLMLRYRAAAFFGRLYAPDLLMGIRGVDEIHDQVVIDDGNVIDAETGEVLKAKTMVEDLNAKIKEKSKTQKPAQEEPLTTPAYDTEGIAKEIAEVKGKATIEAVDVWCNKHYDRLEKKYGGETAGLIMAAGQERRNELSSGTNGQQDDDKPETIICPDSGQEIVKSDCEGTQCAEKCILFVK